MQLPIPRHLIAAATLAFVVGTAVPGNAFAADGSTDLADDNQVVAEAVSSEDNETSVDEAPQAADAEKGGIGEVVAEGDTSVPEVTTETEDSIDDETLVEPANAIPTDATAEAAAEITPEADTALLTTMGGAEDEQQSVPDGTYTIGSLKNNKMVLDVADNGSTNGTNVQIYSSYGSNAQKWDVRHVADGLYNILKHNTDMALSIANGVAKSAANVEIRKLDSSGTDGSQLWCLSKLSNGCFNIISSLDPNIVLDIKNGTVTDRQNVQVYKANDTEAQQFKLFAAATPGPSDYMISDGTYTIKCASNKSYSVDIYNGLRSSGANVQLYTYNNTQAQKFYFKSDGKGYYTISVIGSGKVLATTNGSPIVKNNVQQSTYTGANTQKWSLQTTSNGIKIVNMASGLTLDVSGGVLARGRNIQGYYDNGTDAQRFVIDKTNALTDGIYVVRSFLDVSKVFDIASASTAENVRVQVYSSNNTTAQRFGIEALTSDTDEELYMIKTGASGGYLTSSGTTVVQRGNHNTKSNDYNTWKLVWNGTYFSMRNVYTGNVLDLPNAKATNGNKLQTYKANGTNAQHFYFVPANLLVNGTYLINSTVPNQKLVLDVVNASTSYDANIQAFTKSGHIAQQFTITATDSTSDTYKIKNVNSGKIVSVKEAWNGNAANVVQRSDSNLDSQLWKAEIGDGGSIIFVNGYSGMALTVSGGTSAQPRANVYQYELANDSSRKAQQWKLTRIGWYVSGNTYRYYDVDGNATTFNASSYDSWNRYKDRTSNTKYLMVIDRDRCWANIYTKVAGQWQPLKSWRCAVGSKGSPTPVGEWLTSGRRGTTHVDVEYTAKWVIEVKSPWAFNIHSTPFKPDGRVLTARLGAWITGGCCRLAVDNAHWVYDNIRGGTRVITY